jgi:hypothetical protein
VDPVDPDSDPDPQHWSVPLVFSSVNLCNFYLYRKNWDWTVFSKKPHLLSNIFLMNIFFHFRAVEHWAMLGGGAADG